MWQVRILGDARASAGKPLQEVAAFQPSGGRLTATMSPQWYTGTENRLYRVQIHAGGEPGKATFKWSRRNASIAARIRQYGPAQLHFDSAERFAAVLLLGELAGEVAPLFGTALRTVRQRGALGAEHFHLPSQRQRRYAERAAHRCAQRRFRAGDVLGSEGRGQSRCYPRARWRAAGCA